MKRLYLFLGLSIYTILILGTTILWNPLIGLLLLIVSFLFIHYLKNPEKSLEYLILSAVFLSPCANIFVFQSGFYDFKILPLLWTCIFTLVFIQKAVRKEIVLRNKRNDNTVIILYAFVLLFSCFFSTNFQMSIKELSQYAYLLILMYIIYSKASERAFLNKIVVALILSNAFLIIIALLSYISGKQVIPSFVMNSSGSIFVSDSMYFTQTLIESGDTINRMRGVFGMAMTGISNCILIQSLFVNYYIRMAKGTKRVLAICLFAGNFITIVLAYSRAAMVLFFVIHLITFFNKSYRRNIIVLVAAVCGVVLFLSVFPYVIERVLETFNFEEASSKYHTAIWLIALKTGFNNMLTGIGLGNMAYSYGDYASVFHSLGLAEVNGVNVHNFLLQIWSEQGLIGLIINAVFFFGPIIFYVKEKFIIRTILEKKSIYDFIMLAYVTSLLYNLTNNNFYIETFWILFGMVFSTRHYLMGLKSNSWQKENVEGRNIIRAQTSLNN